MTDGNHTKAWRAAKKKIADAKAYLSLIGKTTTSSTVAHRDGPAATAGALTTLKVVTQINFQPYDGATNYHDCVAFDDAISSAARENWPALQRRALEILSENERKSAQLAKEELEAELAEVSS